MSVITITKDNFEKEVLQSEKPVLLDFWAPWCGPCRMVAPILEEVAQEVTSCKVGKINVDEEENLAQRYNIMSIPTLLIIKNGTLVKSNVGALPKEDILAMLSSV
ncbi:MAG: thioredoxin [Spirochaetaceae bacterium]|nr:thioredoxin [Spirochaetaceae bacterium]